MLETTTPVAVTWPAFVTFIEYVSVAPGDTLPGADSVIPTSAGVCPPPPPATTLYVEVSVDGLPTLSVDVTVNVLVPLDDVSIGLPLATGP